MGFRRRRRTAGERDLAHTDGDGAGFRRAKLFERRDLFCRAARLFAASGRLADAPCARPESRSRARGRQLERAHTTPTIAFSPEKSAAISVAPGEVSACV